MNAEKERIEFVLDKWRKAEHARQIEQADILQKIWASSFEGEIWDGFDKTKEKAEPNWACVRAGLQRLWKHL